VGELHNADAFVRKGHGLSHGANRFLELQEYGCLFSLIPENLGVIFAKKSQVKGYLSDL
jgi:hypothetical protein